MKKVIIISLALFISLVFSTLVFANDVEYGDINHSKSVDAADALLVLKHSAKIETIEEADLVLADVTGDTNIDAKDALDILKYAAKIIEEFVVEGMVKNTEEPTVAPTNKPTFTAIPTDPPSDIIVGTYPTAIPIPVVEANPENYIEGTAVELVNLNGATEENGIYTFTDENDINEKGISFKNPFAGMDDQLLESFDKALEGQTIELTDNQKIVFDPEAKYPEPVWNTGVSLSFWAKYDWNSELKSNNDPILVFHRSEETSRDFVLAVYLDGSVKYETGDDAKNSFRADGAICGNYNEWNHYTVTIKNDWITVYVNGQESVYQKVALSKSAIGLFNGGYMTKYNVAGMLTEEQLLNDIRYYYKTSGSVSNGVIDAEATRVDTGVFEGAGYNLGAKLIMECMVDSNAEIVLGGTNTYKLVGHWGKATYSLKSGTQAAGLKAYFVDLSAEQVAAIYAEEASSFLK